MKYDTLIYRAMIFIITMTIILCGYNLKIKQLQMQISEKTATSKLWK